MRELLEAREAHPFTAVYVSSYKMSCGALKAIREQGLRIPEDVAVVAFDFLDETGLNVPSITTITQPTESIGTIALTGCWRGSDAKRRRRLLPSGFCWPLRSRRVTAAREIKAEQELAQIGRCASSFYRRR